MGPDSPARTVGAASRLSATVPRMSASSEAVSRPPTNPTSAEWQERRGRGAGRRPGAARTPVPPGADRRDRRSAIEAAAVRQRPTPAGESVVLLVAYPAVRRCKVVSYPPPRYDG